MVSIEWANGVSRIRRTLGTYGAYDPLIWAEVKKIRGYKFDKFCGVFPMASCNVCCGEVGEGWMVNGFLRSTLPEEEGMTP